MNQAVEEELTKIFREVFEDDTIVITPTLTADDIANWNSLTNIRLITRVEDVFQIEFLREELQTLKDVQGLIDLIRSKS